MGNQLEFWVIGGDLRQHWLARQLADKGHIVHTYGLNLEFLQSEQDASGELSFFIEDSLAEVYRAHCVILPLPLLNAQGQVTAPFGENPIEWEEVCKALSSKQLICGGQMSPFAERVARDYNLTILDYFTREELVIANAVPTAEGCLQIAMERLPITLQGARVMVLGYGKVGTATAKRFGALGSKVTVGARSYSQLAQGRADGFQVERLDQMVGYLCGYDCVINTIPALVLGKKELEDMRGDVLIIDLASAPGGVDLEAAEGLHRRVIPALSLPGKVAPATAGESIGRTVKLLLEERGFR